MDGRGSSGGGSGGGWSELRPSASALDTVDDGDALPLDAHPFRIDARYETLELAGRGGMGEVMVARDRRLGRDVALKRLVAVPADEALSRRLTREAWVTARLEHPSIVPVYDAGESDDGRLYYTMRLIHGRSLRDVLKEHTTLDARLGLLRHFLALCEAVAYAHSHGIIHRDLKPANIMVGAFGETQLVDWGLAGFASEAAARAFAAELPQSADLSQATAFGTPAYMAPEQAKSGTTSPRTDVWALGAILHEIVVGERLLVATSSEHALEQLRSGDVDRSRLRAATGPAELCTIIEKATAARPEARYRDAGDLAADLARYLDGRRVVAHVYTTLELARRLVRRLRVPIAALAGALLAASFAIGASFRTISKERTRAVEAEASARTALDESRRTASWALSRQSVIELDEGALAEAELLAAHALAEAGSADARGVLAAARAGGAPDSAETIELPACPRVVPGTWDLALCLDASWVALYELSPVRLRWRQPLSARHLSMIPRVDGEPRIVATTGRAELLVLDTNTGMPVARFDPYVSTGLLSVVTPSLDGALLAATEGRMLSIISLDTESTREIGRTCVVSPIAAVAAGPEGFVVVCRDGTLHGVDPSSGETRRLWQSTELGAIVPTSAAVTPDGRTLVAGGIRGALVRIELSTGTVTPPVQVHDSPIIELELLPPGDRVFASGERGGARLWALDANVELLRMPAAFGQRTRLTPEGLVTGGRRAGRWGLARVMPPRRLTRPAGLSAIALSPDGAYVAAAQGDGAFAVIDRATGRAVYERSLGRDVIKTLDFSPDGRRLAVSISESFTSPRAFGVGTWDELQLDPASRGARRLIHDVSGALIGFHYSAPHSRWSTDGHRSNLEGPEVLDVWASLDRRELLAVAVDGTILRHTDGALVPLGRDEGAATIAGFPRRRWLATGHPSGVTIREDTARERWIPNDDGALTDLAASPDERWLVGARTDGTIAVWRVT
ncbi:WD40 repeat domain-containing serine/threonine protein kinase, partial [Myxococcota bacterium]|nr:WD40 repeat domain-containing serine/threonine protein kinase [Myxococcota bacterium]